MLDAGLSRLMSTDLLPEATKTVAGRLRIAVVTPLFPLSTDPSRGLPIYRTIQELSRLSDVGVFVPMAAYPKWRWLHPKSYTYRRQNLDILNIQVNGLTAQYLEYQALPGLTRPLNGSRVRDRLLEPVRAFRPDVVLAYWLYPEGYGAYQVARELDVPFVAGVRGSDLLRLPDVFTKWMVRRELANASAVLTVSRRLKTRTLQLGGAEDRVRVQLNGCDRTEFHPSDRRAARRRLGVDGNAEVVLFVGHLVPVKGVQYLLRAAAQLLASRPNLELVIVGEGNERAALLAELATSGTPLKVHFVNDEPPHRVAEWMAACDAFCLPSINEGCPNVVIEAICCGRPVVATDVGANPDLISRKNGVLVPPREPERLAAALDQVLSREWDPAAIAGTFQRGWDVVARETFDVCRSAVTSALRLSARNGS